MAIRHQYDSQEQSIQFGTQEVAHAGQVSDDLVTSGKMTLAGLGENNDGATELINHNQIEYARSVEYSDLAQMDVNTDQQAHDHQLSVGSQVRSLFNNA